MTCRRGMGGCGHTFYWDVSLVKPRVFTDTWLCKLAAPLVFAAGTATGEALLLPEVGALTWLNTSAMLAVGFILAHAVSADASLGPRRSIAVPLVSAPLAATWIMLH